MPSSRRIKVNMMESKSWFLKSSSDGSECPQPCLSQMKPWLFSWSTVLGVPWLNEDHKGASWNRPLLPSRKGVDFIPSLLLGKKPL